MGKYTFGPVASRRFGLSLGIDLSPDTKSCNFDCLYCELPFAQTVDSIKNPPKIVDVLAEVKSALTAHPDTEVLTITANGEPTLFPDLENLIDQLIEIKADKRLLILSNASTIMNPKIQQALLKIETVKLSLDAVTPNVYKKIDRSMNIPIETIIEGIIEFSKKFQHELVIEILLVSGINDKLSEFIALKPILEKISAKRIDIGTIDRPPAYNVKPVSFEKISMLCEVLDGLPFNIVTKPNVHPAKSYYDQEELLSTFAKRPFSQNDVTLLFDDMTLKNLEILITDKKVEKIEKNGQFFFKIA
jgi:wyosine [tRNA(Phe)-imidazoG37] synthetase (radical SAM superfamily)